MKSLLSFFIISLSLVNFSCQQSQVGSERASFAAADFSEKAVSEVAISERKIIKEGEISFETPNAAETRNLINTTLSEYNGYTAADNVYDYNEKTQHRIEIKIPSKYFEPFIEKISQHADKLDSKNITAQDVTEEFIDVEARIKTKKELENRYKELLKQAQKVDELLTIEREIGNLRSDIESIEGRLKYLENRVSYSSLTLNFYEKTKTTFGFGGKIVQALQSGWTNLLWFLVGMVNIWPFIVLGAVGVYAFKRYRKK